MGEADTADLPAQQQAAASELLLSEQMQELPLSAVVSKVDVTYTNKSGNPKKGLYCYRNFPS